MSHLSTHWLLPYNRTQYYFAGWAERVILQDFLETTRTKLVATFSTFRICERIQTNGTVLA